MITEQHYKMTVTKKNIYGHRIVTYGIKGTNVFFDDISTDKDKVSEMIDRLNREHLEESQFMYFVEDELV